MQVLQPSLGDGDELKFGQAKGAAQIYAGGLIAYKGNFFPPVDSKQGFLDGVVLTHDYFRIIEEKPLMGTVPLHSDLPMFQILET